ncbi:MAG TPA: immunoglobulin-like domain-containing protein [Flavobacterium sp.]
MKKIIYFLLVMVAVSCSEASTDNVSKVTNYPVMTLNGERTVILNQGDTYTELGVVAIEGTTEIPTTITGTVDTSIPNVYKLTYTAVNVDGFTATLTRAIVVLSTAPSTINLEGTFARNGTNLNNVTRISEREYICDNATGFTNGSPDNLTLTFYNIDDIKIYAPYQENASSTGISAESNVGTIVDQDHWSWVIFASGVFGTATRVFTRI